MTNETGSELSGGAKWTACNAYTWVAFRKARSMQDNVEFPQEEWRRDWKHWPPWGLSNAFHEIETGVPWELNPDDWPELDADIIRARARHIIKETGESARELNDSLKADLLQCERNQNILIEAVRDVMAEVRAGHLTVWARPAFKFGLPNVSACHEVLSPLLFEGPRGISIFGNVDYSGSGTPGFDFLEYHGPWYDEVRFSIDQVTALWPALPDVGRIASTMGDETRLTGWLVKRMREALNAPPGKLAVKQEAKRAGLKFSERAFSRAWLNAAREAEANLWIAPGRKSKH